MPFASLPVGKALRRLNWIALGLFLLETGRLVWFVFNPASSSGSSGRLLVDSIFFIAGGIYLAGYVRNYYKEHLRTNRGLLFFGLGLFIMGVAKIPPIKEDLILVHIGLRVFSVLLFLAAFIATLAGSVRGADTT